MLPLKTKIYHFFMSFKDNPLFCFYYFNLLYLACIKVYIKNLRCMQNFVKNSIFYLFFDKNLLIFIKKYLKICVVCKFLCVERKFLKLDKLT